MKLNIEDLIVLLTACQFSCVHAGDEWDQMAKRLIAELNILRKENKKDGK